MSKRLAISLRESHSRGLSRLASSTRPPGPVPVSAAERAAWSERQERMLWWNALYKNGGDVFTLEGVSPTLQKWWPRVAGKRVEKGEKSDTTSVRRVLIPGVGRDVSAAWLARQEGWGAVGVDFADAPLRALGELQGGLTPIHEGRSSIQGSSRWAAYQANDTRRLLLVHGDFLALGPDDYGGLFEAAWDRGALTSVPDRASYALALARALAPGAVALLELLCADVAVEGAVDEAEALAVLRSAGFKAERLEIRSVLTEYPDFRPPGLTKLDELVIIATKQ